MQGNAGIIVITEAISAIPLGWYSTYLPLYMLALGVQLVEIGWLTSALILVQFISTLLGGYAADRFGRKRILVVFDILCWGIPMLLYAIAQNPWYFLAGRLINGLVYIVMPSFECLFIEDVPHERRPAVFGALQLLTAGATLLMPIAGLLVAWLGIITGGRVIMATCMTCMIAVAIVRQATLQETSIGKERMQAISTVDPRQIIRDYVSTLRLAIREPRIRTFLLIRNLHAFSTVIWTTFGVIYMADVGGLGLSESSLAFLPFIQAIVMIGLILVAARRMQTEWVFSNLLIGKGLWLIAALCFILAPQQAFWAVALWAVLYALGEAFFTPASQVYWAGIVGDQERASIFSASFAMIALSTLPAGPLAGFLYTLAPYAPFVLAISVQFVTLLLLLSLKTK